MSDCVSPEPQRNEIDEAIAALTELTATGGGVDGELQIAESTWAIYGHTSYDGEIIVGEYHDAAEAAAVLRSVPHPLPDQDRPVRLTRHVGRGSRRGRRRDRACSHVSPSHGRGRLRYG
jgi:hypothetical protein